MPVYWLYTGWDDWEKNRVEGLLSTLDIGLRSWVVTQITWGINLCLEKEVRLRSRLGSKLTFFSGSVNLDFFPGSNLKISYPTQQDFQARMYLQLPLRQWGRQCLPLSVVQLKDEHCRKPHRLNGVVDTFGPSYNLVQTWQNMQVSPANITLEV